VTGALVLVATPIGNLGDLSPRAAAALADADLVVCEDTRRTGRLLKSAGVKAKGLLAAHGHNEAAAARQVLERLAGGETVAVVTDAGTPGISDPGERLVRAAVDAGHEVRVVPGPTAAIAGLVASGLASDRFVFEGFLPRSGAERGIRLASVAAEERTVVLYEAPHRLVRTLTDLATACGPDRPVALARELTKLHEEVWRGTLNGALERAGQVEPRGEYVVVLGGAAPAPEVGDHDLVAALAGEIAAGASTRDAVAQVAATFGVARRRVYALANDPGFAAPRPGPLD
jgi:16S rRNA (cytidine1402-2'-O)-methyltransferase